MGNECSDCDNPANECVARDKLKEIPRNRTDLDLSEIKKGEYKKRVEKVDRRN